MVKARFDYMLEAFCDDAPSHGGGIALGFDRMIGIRCDTPSIRDVIAFPKPARGTYLLTDSPGGVEPKQLRELYLEIGAARKPQSWLLGRGITCHGGSPEANPAIFSERG